jgi:predicted methyltransferase
MMKLPPMITPEVAKRILNGETNVSLDLGLSSSRVARVGESYDLLGYMVSGEDLKQVAGKENAVYFPEGDQLYQVAVAGERYFKLVPTAGAPTLEIDGVRMHRTKETTPDADTKEKLEALGLAGGRVLDTCMGVGYTAIGALSRGADVVVTVEREPSVVRVAQMNPWSSQLFEGGISLLLGDSFHTIDALPTGFFDWAIHDPPRLTHAGALYSEEFYGKLYRVMAEGARLFHYTGEPRSRYRGVDLQKGVQKRLRAAGFKVTEYHPGVMGVTCEK